MSNKYQIDNLSLDLGNNYRAEISIKQDDICETPWEWSDGHGVISEWTMRDKLPGERVLCADRHSKRFYDVQASMLIARRDGWDAKPFGQGTNGERAARAVNADFEYLRAWCNDEWCYVSIQVTVYLNDTELTTDYLGGVESFGDYWKEEGERMARDIADDNANTRHSTWRAALHEARERKYWIQRDVLTA